MFITMYRDKEKRKTDRDRWYLCRWWRKRNDELRQSWCDVCWLAWVRENSISWNGFTWLFFFFNGSVVLSWLFWVLLVFWLSRSEGTEHRLLLDSLSSCLEQRGHVGRTASLPSPPLTSTFPAPALLSGAGCRKCFPNQQELLLCPQGSKQDQRDFEAEFTSDT